MSHAYALNTVLDVYDAVYQTIEEVRNRDGGSDFKLGADCNGLLSYLTSYRFLMTALSFKKIFEILEPLTRTLQARDIDILAAMYLVNSAKESIVALRTEETFENILILAKEFDDNMIMRNLSHCGQQENVKLEKWLGNYVVMKLNKILFKSLR
ncbi:unnamed protein product [Macrosiphum euphorbiae]|uniref:Uncharacterized protein n=1 Tax=Macrosiphum euphorbiae TaxID=13131 RepID=A0AAV0WQI2_9HEMI|nr:unnamed protein product [Macrosiphum euphorbiae]